MVRYPMPLPIVMLVLIRKEMDFAYKAIKFGHGWCIALYHTQCVAIQDADSIFQWPINIDA